MTDLAAKAKELLEEGKVEESLATSRQAWPLAKKSADKKVQAEVLLTMIKGLSAKGAAREAFKAASSSLSIVKDSGDNALVAEMLNVTAKLQLQVTQSSEDLAAAVANAEEAVKMYKTLKDKKGEAVAMTTLASAQCKDGSLNKAITTAEAALDLWRPLEVAAGSAAALEVIVDAQTTKGQSKATMKVLEDEFSKMKAKGFSGKNEVIMLEMMVSTASSQGFSSESLTYYDQLIAALASSGDQMGEAMKTLECAEAYFGLKANQDAKAYAKKAAGLFKAMGEMELVDRANKLITDCCLLLGQINEAPYRSEGFLALKEFTKGVEMRDFAMTKEAEEKLDKALNVIKESDINMALENLFEKDPSAMKFVEELGWDVSSFRTPEKIYQYPHKSFYMNMILYGMNFGPQFRGVHPGRVGKRSDAIKPKSVIVAQCYDHEKWNHSLQYRHCLMDSPIQSSNLGFLPPY
mmetsp:Transcript_61936/g.113234  ORF Transcript_61936/g.113234 Transcript_61936/m.113234 type:complete len:464 (-) Transcript_61936:122-1513(-)